MIGFVNFQNIALNPFIISVTFYLLQFTKLCSMVYYNLVVKSRSFINQSFDDGNFESDKFKEQPVAFLKDGKANLANRAI